MIHIHPYFFAFIIAFLSLLSFAALGFGVRIERQRWNNLIQIGHVSKPGELRKYKDMVRELLPLAKALQLMTRGVKEAFTIELIEQELKELEKAPRTKAEEEAA